MRQRKIYLAAPFDWAEKIAGFEYEILTNTQHDVVTNWYHDTEQGLSLREIAERDIVQLQSANTLIVFTDKIYRELIAGFPVPGVTSFLHGSGGHAVEFGFALANDLEIFLVGPLNSVFHYLIPLRNRFRTVPALISHLTSEAPYGQR